MKKLIFIILLFLQLVLVSFSFSPKKANAYLQTPGYCKAQGAAYHFYWMGDYCWDLFQANCVVNKGGVALKMGMFLFSMATNGGLDVGTPLKATFFCAPLIDQCIAPELKNFEYHCKDDNTYYAPNLTVTSSWIGTHVPGLIYDDEKKTLTATVMNNGMNPAMDIEVGVTWGSTKNRDKMVSGGGTLINGRIPMLRFRHAQQNGKDTPQQQIINWLVSQTNFSNYFPPDPTISEIPFFWQTTVPFTAPEGEFTKVIINVDPSQMIPEMTETDNTYILEIDKLPTLHRFSLDNFKYERQIDSLTDYTVSFDLENSGDLSGTAQVKWFEGEYNQNKSPQYALSQVVNGKSTVQISQAMTVDVGRGSSTCATSKRMTLVIADEDGIQITRGFSIPLFAGEIYGDVEDLKGKPIVNALVETSSGQTTRTSESGSYHIRGIPVLGKITVTVTHPEYSKKEVREVEMKFDSSKDDCHIDGLTHLGFDFVLKDQDVLFDVIIKDTSGNPVTANVLAVNSDWRFDQTVNGTSPLPGMQPGKYMFTISSAGYKTISQDINAVPNNQHLEFTLEKLLGRPDDSSMRLITPKLLWKKALGAGERIISNMSGSKNGKLIVAYALDNKVKNSNLYFLDLITGRLIKETPVPYGLGYEGFVGLDTSYDGETVGLNVDLGIKKDNERILKIFNSSGNEIGSTTLSKGRGGAVTFMDVSPDGFYLCTGNLFNKGLHKYTRYETEGKMDYKRGSTAPAVCGKHFLRNNNIVIPCEGKQEGYCEETLANQQVRVIGDIDEGGSSTNTLFDSTFNDQTVVVRTFKKLYYLGGSSWKKEVKSDNMYKSVAVSPGGMYTIVTEGNGSSTLLKLKIFGNTGGDKTPDFPYKNVKFVFANDKGLFFAQVVLNRIEFYQIGEYQIEYKPQTMASPTPATLTSGLYQLINGKFNPISNIKFEDLVEGQIYSAGQNIYFGMGGLNGTLHVLNGTIFSVDQDHHPILLKGQLTAEFNSPTTVYAIKFDRFSMDLFKSKLSQFIAGTLTDDEYFIVKNIHTKFTVKNDPNNINVAVENGEVKVTVNKIEKTIEAGKQISIDAANNVTESAYIDIKIYAIILGVIILIAGIILFIYRKTKAGSKIIEILINLIKLIWKIGKFIAIGLWKIVLFLSNKIVNLINIINKKGV